MNVLFLAPRFPLPADTGAKIRTLNILKQISRFANVDLVCFSFEKGDAAYTSELAQMNIHTHLVESQEPPLFEKLKQVAFNDRPFSVIKYAKDSFEDILKKVVRENIYDVVHVDHIHMADYRHCFAHIPSIVDEHNVEYKILERCAAIDNSFLKRSVFLSQAKKMRKFESRIAQDYQRCFTVSLDDKQLLEKLVEHKTRVNIIANGVDTRFFQANGHHTDEDSLVFTGSMDWLPNDDAMVYFIEECLPLIWKEKQNVKLTIVGKNPSQKLRNYASQDKRIVVTGRVDDVRSYISQSKIFVVPIRIGGGTRLKILEAMSMKMPVVSTRIGAEGIDYEQDKDIAISDDPKSFARCVLDLLKDGNRRKAMGERARELVCQQYDWDIIGGELKKVYQEIQA